MKINYVIYVSLTFCIGCGMPYHVNVDSISSGNIQLGKKCILMSTDPNITTSNNLQYKEYASYVKNGLQKKGYLLTENLDGANIVIFLNYGISGPQESLYSYSTPVYGQSGISSSYTTGTIYNYGSNMSSFSGSTTYTPEYGITGYQSHIGTRISYTRFLILEAYDLNEYMKTKKEVQIWRTLAISSGSSNDFRKVFPVMIAASSEYIGKNTGKQIKVVLFENDKRVKEIKGLPSR